MKLRISTLHATELRPNSDLRKVVAESTHEADDVFLEGDDLRTVRVVREGRADKVIAMVGELDSWLYYMNDDGSNFDKRYFKAAVA